ncbi:MAG: hypothetical protein H0V61_04025 [Chitinophagales bacterium]|nr:hypothetical protein [Chitinophagales bacterium]
MRLKRILIIITLLLHSTVLYLQAQIRSNIDDTTVNAKLLTFSYSVQIPVADLAERFGTSNCLGGGLYFKIPHNILLGAEANYIFGGNIREDSILNFLYTSSGGLIGIDGLYETVFLFERGIAFWGKFGKIIPVFNSNPNTGITLIAGAGFLQHRIKFSSPNHTLPYLSGDYLKGYDRLSNGFAVSQYIGYTHLDKRKLMNFTFGVEVIEAFTKSRRDWNMDQMKKDESKRFDMLLGIKVGWILPFYGRGEERIYTY